VHVDALLLKHSCVVERLVQPDYSSHVELGEVGEECLWTKSVALAVRRRR